MLFKYFPEITYNDHKIRDITRHASFIQNLNKDPYVYLPYTLKDYEKPEDVSYFYYGTVEYTPYVLMANQVVDPYLDWLMTDEILNNHIVKKYQKSSGMKGDDVLRWAINATRFDNIVEFRNADGWVKSTDTYIDEFIPEELQEQYYNNPKSAPFLNNGGTWFPIRVYDWEVERNESKRVINVIDRSLIKTVHSQFIELINR